MNKVEAIYETLLLHVKDQTKFDAAIVRLKDKQSTALVNPVV